jgi:hypothetical protein
MLFCILEPRQGYNRLALRYNTNYFSYLCITSFLLRKRPGWEMLFDDCDVSRPLFLPVISTFQVYVFFCVFTEKAFSDKLSGIIYLNCFSKFFR